MKLVLFSGILLFAMIANTNLTFAENTTIAPCPITVNLEKDIYVGSEAIKISGTVEPSALNNAKNTKLLIKLLDPKNREYKLEEIPVSPDGTYNFSTKLANDAIAGTYELMVLFNGYSCANVFMYIPGPYKLVIEDKSYPINYKITAGKLAQINVNSEEKSLAITIVNTNSNNQHLTIELTRKVMDAIVGGTSGSDFTVLSGMHLSNMQQVDFEEIKSDDNQFTTLIIETPYGAENHVGTGYIKIIGTKLKEQESPLKQFKSGIAAEEVICKENLKLIFKVRDGSPACVLPLTYYKLAERGWAKFTGGSWSPDRTVYPDPFAHSNTYKIGSFEISATIINGSINSIHRTVDSNSIFVELSPFNDGNLIIKIPKTMLKAIDDDYSKFSFFVLSDGEETPYEQIDPETIKINFQNYTKKIEIIGASRLN